jgi:hypothetical protein
LWFRPRGFDIKTWGKLNLFRGQHGFVIMGCSWGNIMLSLCHTLWHPELSFRASWWCPKATLWHCPTFSLRTTLILFIGNLDDLKSSQEWLCMKVTFRLSPNKFRLS